MLFHQVTYASLQHSEIEHLEERDFLTFRNEIVKLLSEIQYKVKERKKQVTTSQQVTTFQLSEATQTIHTHHLRTSCAAFSDSHNTAATVIAKVQQPQGQVSVSAQPTSYLVVDDQQPGTPRQLMFNLSSI